MEILKVIVFCLIAVALTVGIATEDIPMWTKLIVLSILANGFMVSGALSGRRRR